MKAHSMEYTNNKFIISVIISTSLLTACGGSSSKDTSKVVTLAEPLVPLYPPLDPPLEPPLYPPLEPVWVKDQFTASTYFAAQCESPRVGNSPITGKNYQDKQGSELLEKHWQRAFNNETYLWYKDVIDKDPRDFNLIDYFAQLKTTETTDSGRNKDQFHWLQPTSEVEASSQLGVSYGYGFTYGMQQKSPPRELIVQNVILGTQAVTKGISRGSKLLEIDGIDFVNTRSKADLDIINKVLISNNEGEKHTFKFANVNDIEYVVELQRTAIKGVPLQIVKTIKTAQGKTGYLLLNSFNNSTVEKDLFDSFTIFAEQEINDLIIDLRYNGGGYLALSSQLAYMVAGHDATVDKVYEKIIFNDKIDNQHTPFLNKTLDLRKLIGGDSTIQAGKALPTLDLNRVYVLTTGSSCSASESFINGLIGIDVEVIQIGTTTCGKPYGFESKDNCGSTYFTVQFKGANAKGFGDYPDGLIPTELPEAGKLAQVQGCPILEDYQHALGDEQELLLASALYYQRHNDCPEIVAKSALKMRTITAKSLYVEEGTKLELNSPLQNAIIRDVYFDKYRHIKAGDSNDN
jgi:carboxyl-terminal processing protease